MARMIGTNRNVLLALYHALRNDCSQYKYKDILIKCVYNGYLGAIDGKMCRDAMDDLMTLKTGLDDWIGTCVYHSGNVRYTCDVYTLFAGGNVVYRKKNIVCRAHTIMCHIKLKENDATVYSKDYIDLSKYIKTYISELVFANLDYKDKDTPCSLYNLVKDAYDNTSLCHTVLSNALRHLKKCINFDSRYTTFGFAGNEYRLDLIYRRKYELKRECNICVSIQWPTLEVYKNTSELILEYKPKNISGVKHISVGCSGFIDIKPSDYKELILSKDILVKENCYEEIIKG